MPLRDVLLEAAIVIVFHVVSTAVHLWETIAPNHPLPAWVKG